jgi:hypothetical protein
MNAPRQTNRLSGKDNFDMQVCVREFYSQLGLHDGEFAEKASEALGFPVTKGNVQGAREVFGIPSTRAVALAAPTDQSGQIAALSARLARLEERIEVYFKGCRKESTP